MTGEAPLLQPGQQVGRYRVVRELGAGGMGAVYEALHVGLNKRVAMKVLHPVIDRDPAVRARFLREGEVAARIRHPNVVDVHDVGTEDGLTYLVMDYLEGEDLASLLRRGALPPEQAVELLLPVLDAIHVAHEAGVVHRDLKPANIFLTRDRDGATSPRVLDFGISKVLQDQPAEALTRTGMVVGTPHYMSPEQVGGAKDLDGRADVYALAAIFYECVTGRRAFDGGSVIEVLMKIARGELEPPRAVMPSLPEQVDVIVARGMHGDRAQRAPSPRALGQLMLPLASPAVRARWTALWGAEVEDHRAAPRAPDDRAAPRAPNTVGDLRPLTGNLSAPSLRGPIAGVVAAAAGAAIAWWLWFHRPTDADAARAAAAGARAGPPSTPPPPPQAMPPRRSTRPPPPPRPASP